MNIRKLKLFNCRATIFAIAGVLCFGTFLGGLSKAQNRVVPGSSSQSNFLVGEKLTYNVSFGKFSNAAYVMTSVVSRGNLDGRDVVELTSRLKMLGFVSAAFFQFDEDRTVFAAPDTGLPLYVTKVVNYGVEPKETVGNYLKEPTSYFDLLSIIYKARDANGTGSFSLFENERLYTVIFQPTVSEKVKTEAGEFETVVSVVQSDYLTERGVKELKINFATNEGHVPVMFRVKMAKETFRATLADIQLPKAIVEKIPATPTPAVVVVAAPKTVATAAPYVENQPLSPELGFELGETLDYRVFENGRPIAVITTSAKERKLFRNVDALHLSAVVSGIEQGNGTFMLGDSIHVQVDPETLVPFWGENRFGGALRHLNKNITFDDKSGSIAFGTEKVDAPVGTHTLLSMIYAMRSFNLKPSKDPKNPVNDTRVAVFWESQPYIFVLQPSNPEEITISGERIAAQPVAISTSNDVFDKQGLKVWVAAETRIPVRFSFGRFQADLILSAKKP